MTEKTDTKNLPPCSGVWKRHRYTVGAAYNGRKRITMDKCQRCGKPRRSDEEATTNNPV